MLALEHQPSKKKTGKVKAVAVQDSKQPAPVSPNNNNNSKKDGKKGPQQGQSQSQGKKDGGGAKGQGQSQNKDSQKNKKKFSKPYFVKPWPMGKEYLSKNGNTLRKEFEDHFRDVCHRCGHSSHTADNCRTYTDRTTYLTLCEICRQGLHDCCKSRRPDLVQANILREVKKMYQKMQTAPSAGAAGYWQYSIPPPPVPPAVTQAESSSDED